MNEIDETEALSTSEEDYIEEFEAPELADTWGLGDFEDLLDCMKF